MTTPPPTQPSTITGFEPPPAAQEAIANWESGRTQALQKVCFRDDTNRLTFWLDGAAQAFRELYPDVYYHLEQWWVRENPGQWRVVHESVIIENMIQMLQDSDLRETREVWQRHLLNQLRTRDMVPLAVRFDLIKEEAWNHPFNFQTGEVLSGAAFSNGRVVEEDGRLVFYEHHHMDWHPYNRKWPMPTTPEQDGSGGWVISPMLDQDPDLDYPEWARWTEEIFPDPDLRQLFHELLGATIMGTLNHEQAMPVLHGEAGAGKGTVLRVIGELMAGDVASLGSILNLGNRFATDQLVGKAFAVLSDLGNAKPGRREYDAGLEILKQITGGDPIRVEQKYQKPMTLNLDVQIWAASNFVPDFPYGEEDASAWARRLVPLPVVKPVYTRRDPKFIDRFRDEFGHVCILAIRFHQQRINNGGAWARATASERMTQQMTGITGEYAHIEEWLTSCVIAEGESDGPVSLLPGTGMFTTTEELAASLRKFLKYEFTIQSPTWRYAKERITSNEIGARVARRKVAGKVRTGFIGIQLVPED